MRVKSLRFRDNVSSNLYNSIIHSHPAYDINELKIYFDTEKHIFKPNEIYKEDEDVLDLVKQINNFAESVEVIYEEEVRK